jgi:hypothetical protein
VTSNGGAFSEAAEDAALYVDPENPDDIAEAVCRVLQDDALRQLLKVKSLKRAKDLTWDKCASETLAVFESLFDNKSAFEREGFWGKLPDLFSILQTAWNWHKNNPKGYA